MTRRQRRDRRFHTVNNGSGEAVLDDFRHRAASEGQDWRVAGHGLDHGVAIRKLIVKQVRATFPRPVNLERSMRMPILAYFLVVGAMLFGGLVLVSNQLESSDGCVPNGGCSSAVQSPAR